MNMPTEARGSDYFNSSVTYDVQTDGKSTLWSETTDDMDPDQDPNANTAESSETKFFAIHQRDHRSRYQAAQTSRIAKGVSMVYVHYT